MHGSWKPSNLACCWTRIQSWKVLWMWLGTGNCAFASAIISRGSYPMAMLWNLMKLFSSSSMFPGLNLVLFIGFITAFDTCYVQSLYCRLLKDLVVAIFQLRLDARVQYIYTRIYTNSMQHAVWCTHVSENRISSTHHDINQITQRRSSSWTKPLSFFYWKQHIPQPTNMSKHLLIRKALKDISNLPIQLAKPSCEKSNRSAFDLLPVLSSTKCDDTEVNVDCTRNY